MFVVRLTTVGEERQEPSYIIATLMGHIMSMEDFTVDVLLFVKLAF